MGKVALFDSTDRIERLRRTAAILSAGGSEHENARRVALILRLIANNAAKFDSNCQLNIGWIGPSLLEGLDQIQSVTHPELDSVTATLYRFLLEFDLSTGVDSLDIRQFLKDVDARLESMQSEAQTQIRFARQQMPIAIVKELLNSDDFVGLKNVNEVVDAAQIKVKGWEETLGNSQEKVDQLQQALLKQERAFNFVGLHHGFADLEGVLNSELKISRKSMFFFGTLMIFPSTADVFAIVLGVFDPAKPVNLIAAATGALMLTFLFLYFFRIALRKGDSCRAQLVQIRLRMTLCRFIQSYADYSSEMKKKNSDALAKFEALIFSGIVGTEEKLPSTFDGIEQFSAMLKSVKG